MRFPTPELCSMPPAGATDEGKLVKVDRYGNAEDLGVPPGIFQHVSMARRWKSCCGLDARGRQVHVFVIDLRRPSLLTRLTSDGTINAAPIWSPQGDKIYLALTVVVCRDCGFSRQRWQLGGKSGSRKWA